MEYLTISLKVEINSKQGEFLKRKWKKENRKSNNLN